MTHRRSFAALLTAGLIFASLAPAFAQDSNKSKDKKDWKLPPELQEALKKISKKFQDIEKAKKAGRPIPLKRKEITAPMEKKSTTLLFENLYSRPNDDSLQNAEGNNGEPYEVAKIKVGLTATKNQKTGGTVLGLEWAAEATTGYHLEGGLRFELAEKVSKDEGRKPVRTGFTMTYPKGVTKNSPPKDKIGLVLSGKVVIREIKKDGVYSGTFFIKKKNPNEKIVPGHKRASGEVFQIIDWSVTLKDGKIVAKSLDCQRFKKPYMRLIASNFQNIDKTLKKHQPYPKKPNGAENKKEVIGSKAPKCKDGVCKAPHSKKGLTENISKRIGRIFDKPKDKKYQ